MSMCELSGDLRDGDASDVKMTGIGSVFDIGGPDNEYFSQRMYDESWGGGNWMDRLGLGEFKDGMGGQDNSNQEKTDEINALKQVTTGAGYGGSKAAKFSTNKKNAVGKKALVIKKPRS